jgi:hypothetical protein
MDVSLVSVAILEGSYGSLTVGVCSEVTEVGWHGSDEALTTSPASVALEPRDSTTFAPRHLAHSILRTFIHCYYQRYQFHWRRLCIQHGEFAIDQGAMPEGTYTIFLVTRERAKARTSTGWISDVISRVLLRPLSEHDAIVTLEGKKVVSQRLQHIFAFPIWFTH